MRDKFKSIHPNMGVPDIDESYIRRCDPVVLRTLLIDRTMTHLNRGIPVNVKWDTDDYARQFEGRSGYGREDQILPDLISTDRAVDLKVVMPRVKKRLDEQRRRSVEKAEVFTPSWICNEQNNLVDEAWFGRNDRLFNVANPDFKTGFDLGPEDFVLRWKAVHGKRPIPFPRRKGRRWRDYVKALRLEVSCGEAPYLTSRYDTTTGKWIEPRSRIGLLDRKLRIVSERCGKDSEMWLDCAEWALKSCYGFEWQGDNVLLARENVLYAVIEAYYDQFNGSLIPVEYVRRFAEIISWNIWQMDGIKFVVPNTCGKKKDMLGGSIECAGCAKNDVKLHDGVRCRVMDWEINKPGGLVRDMTIEQAEHGYSKIRNDGLALALSYMKEVEGWGGGVARYFSDWTTAGLPRPKLEETPGFFKVVFDRKKKANEPVNDTVNETVNETVKGRSAEHVCEHVREHVCEQVERLVSVCKGEMTEKELREAVGVKNRPNFTVRYLSRALEGGFLERTVSCARAPTQKYRLTSKGAELAVKSVKKGYCQ